MKNKILSCLMTLVIVLSIMSPMSIVSSANEKSDLIEAMNEMLLGLNDYVKGDVKQWSDKEVAHAIYGKLLWNTFSHPNYPQLGSVDIDYDVSGDGRNRYDLEDIQKLTRDTYGRDFPENPPDNMLEVSGNKVLLSPADGGEYITWNVQDFEKKGNKLVAVGTAVSHDLFGSYFKKYFEAVFERNSSSDYGYILISCDYIQGNQSFSNMKATASSELKEGSTTHSAKNTIDNNMKTAWAEGVSGNGVNQWIKLEKKNGSEFTVAAIEVALGYHKSEEHLAKNGQPVKLLVECDGGYRQSFDTVDYVDTIVLDEPAQTKWVKITILDVYEGTKYDDTCISEIKLIGIDTTTEVEKVTDDINNETTEQLYEEDSEGDVFIVEDYDDEDAGDTVTTGVSSSGVVIIIILAIMAVMAVAVVGVVAVILIKKKK